MIAFDPKKVPLSIVNKARIVARLGAITVKRLCSVHPCDAMKGDNNLKLLLLLPFVLKLIH
jgi:hypothetical protein